MSKPNKELKQIAKKQQNKWDKSLNRHFSKNYTQMDKDRHH